LDQKYPKNTNALKFAIQTFKKHQHFMSVPIAQLVKALQLMFEYFGPKGLEFKSQPSQKIIFKKIDSWKIIISTS